MKYIAFEDFAYNKCPTIWLEGSENDKKFLILIAIQKGRNSPIATHNLKTVNLSTLARKINQTIQDKTVASENTIIKAKAGKIQETFSPSLPKEFLKYKDVTLIIQNADALLQGAFTYHEVMASTLDLSDPSPHSYAQPSIFLQNNQESGPRDKMEIRNNLSVEKGRNISAPNPSIGSTRRQIPADIVHQKHSIFCFTFPLLLVNGKKILWRVSSREGYLFYIGDQETTHLLREQLGTALNKFHPTIKQNYSDDILFSDYGTAPPRYKVECKYEILMNLYSSPEPEIASLSRPVASNEFQNTSSSEHHLTIFKETILPSLLITIKEALSGPSLLTFLEFILDVKDTRFDQLTDFLRNFSQPQYLVQSQKAVWQLRQLIGGNQSVIGNLVIDDQTIIQVTCKFLLNEKTELKTALGSSMEQVDKPQPVVKTTPTLFTNILSDYPTRKRNEENSTSQIKVKRSKLSFFNSTEGTNIPSQEISSGIIQNTTSTNPNESSTEQDEIKPNSKEVITTTDSQESFLNSIFATDEALKM